MAATTADMVELTASVDKGFKLIFDDLMAKIVYTQTCLLEEERRGVAMGVEVRKEFEELYRKLHG